MSNEAEAEGLHTPIELSRARALIASVFAGASYSDSISDSIEGTEELGVSRRGFTYGETGLLSTLALLRAAELPSYCCKCGHGGLPDRRCTTCGLRPSGAAIVDLGSGIGNVVVGASLLVAAALVRASSVRGVELLPTLHRVATLAVADMHARFSAAAASDLLRLPNALPLCDVCCADLGQHDISDADVCYLCSTAFTIELIAAWADHASRALRPGSRAITLSTPLCSPQFEVERCVRCELSWGPEVAYVQRRDRKSVV